MILYSYKNIWDKIGIGASLLCAIHCVALPLFFTTLPFLGVDIIENIWIEVVTIATSFCMGGWAIVNGYKRYHKNKIILIGFFVGIIFLVVGNFLNIEWLEVVTKIIAAIMLTTVHILNWQKSKHCSICTPN